MTAPSGARTPSRSGRRSPSTVEIEWTRRTRIDQRVTAGTAPADPDATDRSLEVRARRWADDPAPVTAGGTGRRRTRHPQAIDYAFVLDGGEPALPDPRSAWQPHGVHGAEPHLRPGRLRLDRRRLARAAFRAQACSARSSTSCTSAPSPPRAPSTPPWPASTTSSTSGVDVVELMPVAAFPGRWGWGYDGVDLYAVHDAYGGPAALQRFVDACHARGLGVALDVVYNHLGASGNYLRPLRPVLHRGAPHPVGRGRQPRPRRLRAEVRRFLVENALRWFRDFHVDALRLDAVHELKDDSQPHYLRRAVRRRGRPVGRARPPARPRRRERPQRHRHGHARPPRAAGA